MAETEEVFTPGGQPAGNAFEQQAGEAFEAGAGAGEEELPDFDPKDTFHMVEDGTNFYIIAGLFISLTLVCFLIYQLFFKNSLSKHPVFRDLKDEYNLQLPPAVEEYYQFKAKLPDTLTEEHIRDLKNELMKRALQDIPMVLYMQDKSPGTYKLYNKAMIDDRAWRNFQKAEGLVCAEIEEVQREAEEVERGWGEQIWGQAMQLRKILIAKQSQAVQMQMAAAHQQKMAAMSATGGDGGGEEDDEGPKVLSAAEVAADLMGDDEN
ncbi:unnamed protein product [Heterosigma akashiwo]|mmetsp:Transcript_42755/g.73700  ORF Transcript_42755/g.73700 Transcript_42755/m.73700 type:complete len:265 (+) Transcript_42755:84-878(+)